MVHMYLTNTRLSNFRTNTSGEGKIKTERSRKKGKEGEETRYRCAEEYYCFRDF